MSAWGMRQDYSTLSPAREKTRGDPRSGSASTGNLRKEQQTGGDVHALGGRIWPPGAVGLTRSAIRPHRHDRREGVPGVAGARARGRKWWAFAVGTSGVTVLSGADQAWPVHVRARWLCGNATGWCV